MDPVDFFRFRGDEALRMGNYSLAEKMYSKAMHLNASDLPCLMGRASALAALGGDAELASAQEDAAALRQLAYSWIPARVVAAMVVAASGRLDEADHDVAECGHLLEVGGQASMRGYEASVLRAQDAIMALARKAISKAEGQDGESVGSSDDGVLSAAAGKPASSEPRAALTAPAPALAIGTGASAQALPEGKSPAVRPGLPSTEAPGAAEEDDTASLAGSGLWSEPAPLAVATSSAASPSSASGPGTGGTVGLGAAAAPMAASPHRTHAASSSSGPGPTVLLASVASAASSSSTPAGPGAAAFPPSPSRSVASSLPVTPTRSKPAPPRPAPLGLYPLSPVPHPPSCPAAFEALRVTLALADPAASAHALAVSFPVGISRSDEAVRLAGPLGRPLSPPALPDGEGSVRSTPGRGRGHGSAASAPSAGHGRAAEEDRKEEEEEKKEAEDDADATGRRRAGAPAKPDAASDETPEVVFRRMENWLVTGDALGLASAREDDGAAEDAADAEGAEADDEDDDEATVRPPREAAAGHRAARSASLPQPSAASSPKPSAGSQGSAAGASAAEDAAVMDAPRVTGGGPLRSAFDSIRMESFGGGGYRGVVMTRDVASGAEILAVDKRCIVTVDHGKATPVGRRMMAALPPLRLSAARHCYTAVFLLLDQERGGSFFQPYYDVLPRSFDSIPLFWGRDQLQGLQGSYLLTQVAERRRNLERDYHEICRASPDFARFSLHRFTVARIVVASRNFGVVIDGRKTDAMVPYADMLNHLRPRETRWAYNRHRQCFTIHATKALRAGDQVFDSYGRKCNSRFLLNYGFTAEDNRDAETGRSIDELWLRLSMPPPQEDAWWNRKRVLLDGGLSTRGIRIAASNSHAGTREALSFLRFAVAEGRDVSRLPYVGRDVLLGSKPVPALSVENEAAALRALAALCEGQLALYKRPLELDLAELAAGTCPRGSNRRNSLIVLRGEKAVARHFLRLAQVAVPLLAHTPDELAAVISHPVTEDSEINGYVRAVVRPLVNSAASRYYGLSY